MNQSRVDDKIERLINNNKGKHITQGVSFNKDCDRQMGLLRYAFGESVSFSGLIKEMLAQRLAGVSSFQIENDIDRNDIDRKEVKNFIRDDWL